MFETAAKLIGGYPKPNLQLNQRFCSKRVYLHLLILLYSNQINLRCFLDLGLPRTAQLLLASSSVHWLRLCVRCALKKHLCFSAKTVCFAVRSSLILSLILRLQLWLLLQLVESGHLRAMSPNLTARTSLRLRPLVYFHQLLNYAQPLLPRP